MCLARRNGLSWIPAPSTTVLPGTPRVAADFEYLSETPSRLYLTFREWTFRTHSDDYRVSWGTVALLLDEGILSSVEFVNSLPVWVLAAIVVGVCVGFSVGLQLIVRWRYGIDRLQLNHEVAGFKYAVVGVAYAVLLAFVVFGVWSEFDRTDQAVQAEAERLYNLHRNSYNFPDATGSKIREALIAYAIQVRDSDWPMMEGGRRGSKAASEAYTKLSFAVGQTQPDSIELLPSVIHAMNLMQEIADLRLDRLADVKGHMTATIWWVLLLGAIVTLAYPAFFATRDIAPQVLMTAGLAAIIGAILFLTINLNFPFSGPDRLTSEPINNVIERMSTENRAHGGPS